MRRLALTAIACLVLTAPLPTAPLRTASAAPAETEARDALLAQLKAKDIAARLAAAKTAQDAEAYGDEKVTRALLRIVRDDEREIRLEVVGALGNRLFDGERKRATLGLLPRLKQLEARGADPEERVAVIEALGRLRRREAVKPLIAGIDREIPIEEAEARLMAVAEVRDREAIERLIQFLDKGRRGESRKQRAAATRALRHATGETHSRNPDEWRAWWRDVAKTFDFDAVAQARDEATSERDARRERRQRKKKGDAAPEPEPAEEGAPTTPAPRSS